MSEGVPITLRNLHIIWDNLGSHSLVALHSREHRGSKLYGFPDFHSNCQVLRSIFWVGEGFFWEEDSFYDQIISLLESMGLGSIQ